MIRWTPIIWFDHDFDWDFLNTILEYKFRRMSVSIGRNGILTGKDRTAKQLMVCAELCKRLGDEFGENGYYKNADKRFPHRGPYWAKRVDALGKQDQELLATMIRKYYRHWWD